MRFSGVVVSVGMASGAFAFFWLALGAFARASDLEALGWTVLGFAASRVAFRSAPSSESAA